MYECQICKKAPPKQGYPRKWRWKTEKGYLQHDCYANEPAKAAKRDAERIERERQEKLRYERQLEEWRGIAKYKPGDTLFLVHYGISAPTHVQRYGRMVRVRYEELRTYTVTQVEIRELAPGGYLLTTNIGFVREADLFADYREANTECSRQDNAYKAYVKQCEYCR